MKSFLVLARLLIAVALINSVSPASAEDVKISGVVTNAAKRPLKSAPVLVVADRPQYYVPEDLLPLGQTKTNAQGEFSLDVPSTGPVALIAWADGHRMTKFPVNAASARGRTIGLALPAGYRVRGRVIDESTGAPVAHADIGPLAAGLETPVERALRVVPQWTKTDDQGYFELSGLAEDIDHTVLVQASGHAMINVELDRGRQEITVPLSRGGFSVTGMIYARGERDEAFAGKIVRANGNGFNIFRQTNGSGHFSIDGMPGGTFSIEPLFPGGTRAVSVAVVEMPKDDKTSVSLEVSGGYYVSGSTVDIETSSPVHGVPVGLNDHWTTSSTDGTFKLGPFYIAQPLTPEVPEADGWRLSQLLTGREYDVADGFEDIDKLVLKVQRRRMIDVTLSGYEKTTSPVMLTVVKGEGAPQLVEVTSATARVPVFSAGFYNIYATSGGLSTELKAVQVGAESEIPVTLQFHAAGEVTGTVQVTNSQETTRVQTLLLSLCVDYGGEKGPEISLPSQPAADGAFRMVKLPAGRYVLSVRNQSATHETTRPLVVAPGLNDVGVITWRGGHTLTGSVQTAGEKPVPFAEVAVMTAEGQQLRAQADEDGQFKFEDIYADSLLALLVESAGYALYTQRDIALPSAPVQINLLKLGTISITVDAAATSAWTIQIVRMSRWGAGNYADQLMGNPISQAEAGGGETVERTLPESGRFRIVAANRALTDIRVSEPFDWSGDSSAGRNFTLANGQYGSISGTISGAEEPIEVTLINCALPEQTGRDKLEKTVNATNGKFNATGLVAGTYMVLAQGDSYTGYQLNVDVKPGEATGVVLDPIAPATVEGTVELAGEPLPGATVSLLSETDQTVSEKKVTTNAEGQFSFPGLLPDIYQVSAHYDSESGALDSKQSIKVVQDTPLAPVRLNLTPPVPVHFTLDGDSGLTPGSPVSLMNKQTRQLTPAQWINGELEASVIPGEYEVWQGDAVTGTATVSEEGKGLIKK